MTRPLTRALALTALLLPACTTYDDKSEYVGESTYQLAEFTQPDGPTEIYELRVEPSGAAFLDVVREGPKAFQEIGLRFSEMDVAEAQDRKMQPYSGLIVDSVERDSPAERSGLKRGEIVTLVNGSRVFYLKSYSEIMNDLSPNETVRLAVRSAGGESDREVEVKPETKTRLVKDLTRVPLETSRSRNPKPYLGVNLRTVPKKYSKKIYGDDRNAVVISGVGLGSPAYLAGLRAGDVIESIDGKPTPDVDGMLRIIRERGVRGESIVVDVARNGDKPFSTEVTLHDYSGSTGAYIPLVFSAKVGAHRTRWNMILGGILAGYTNSYLSSETREPEQHGSYSMFLGLFKYSWKPSGSRTRLLWFISFG